ncbi:MAG: tRNA (adenosine(37)-N6)-dimethylallyltransferase MiaA, partial [bacterium]
MERVSCLVIIGPTAVGKSNLIYSSFPEAPLHVISADSMQVYRGFDIATATPGSEQLATVKHTGINEKNPSDTYDVQEFLAVADRALRRANDNGLTPVLIGGTALYLKAFLYGLDEMPDKNPEYRQELRETANSRGGD